LVAGRYTEILLTCRNPYPGKAVDFLVAFFYSDYCPTCDDVRPHWEEFVELHRGEGTFIRIKKSPETAKLFKSLGVSWVPTVVFYHDDKEVKRIEGFFTLSDLERAMRRFLSRVSARTSPRACSPQKA